MPTMKDLVHCCCLCFGSLRRLRLCLGLRCCSCHGRLTRRFQLATRRLHLNYTEKSANKYYAKALFVDTAPAFALAPAPGPAPALVPLLGPGLVPVLGLVPLPVLLLLLLLLLLLWLALVPAPALVPAQRPLLVPLPALWLQHLPWLGLLLVAALSSVLAVAPAQPPGLCWPMRRLCLLLGPPLPVIGPGTPLEGESVRKWSIWSEGAASHRESKAILFSTGDLAGFRRRAR